MKIRPMFSLSIVLIATIGLCLTGIWSFEPQKAAAIPQTGISIALQPPIRLVPAHAEQTFHVPARHVRPAANINAATFTITYLPADSTDLWGEPCYTWPMQARAAFHYAASIWAAELNSSVPITIEACWADMTSFLGYSGAYSVMNFPNAPVADTNYSVSLANALAGSDLLPGDADMYITYSGSSNFNWYFGTDGNTPLNAYDFVSVVLHEMCHGLNFGSDMTASGSTASWGSYPGIYDRFTENGSGAALLSFPNNSSQLLAQLTSNNVYFNGTHAREANGGNAVKLYAPNPWRPASSYFHLDEVFNGTINALMTYSIANGESIHDTGPVTRGLLKDLGWPDQLPATHTATPTATHTATVEPSATFTGTPTATVTSTPTATIPSTPTPTVTQTPGANAFWQAFLPLVMH